MAIDIAKLSIFGVTGLPASGKAVFAEVSKSIGYTSVVMGDIIREECQKRGLEVNRTNSNKVMVELRKDKGDDVVALMTLERVERLYNQGKRKIIIDGLRSVTEADIFRKKFKHFEIVAIHASPRQRLERVKLRGRFDDATGMSSFLQRDKVELSVGIGDLIALADYMIDSPDGLDSARELYLSFLMYFKNKA